MSGIDIPRAKNFIFVTQIHFCCLYAICVWDWIISLRKEHRYIWKARWTPVKGLYLFARYWVIFVFPYLLWCFCVNHSEETCQKIFRSPVALALWNQASAEAVLLIRTYAFFGRNKMMLAFLCSLLLGVITYQLYVDVNKMLPLPFLDGPGSTGPCLPMAIPGEAHLLGFFVAPLAFDTIITLITLAKAVDMRRRNGPSSQIIQVFLKEGIFYYLLISGANLINGIFYFQPEADMSAIMIPLSVLLSPLLACRLIIDIRERSEERTGHASSLQANRSPHFGLQMGSRAANHMGSANHATAVLGHAEHGIELESVSGKSGGDFKDDITTYRSVEIPMNGIRVDVEKGISAR